MSSSPNQETTLGRPTFVRLLQRDRDAARKIAKSEERSLSAQLRVFIREGLVRAQKGKVK